MDVKQRSPVRTGHTWSVYGWGDTSHGQLGLGGIEDEQIVTARELQSLCGKEVKDISMGVQHTVFLMRDGLVYSCGNNDFGQLGYDKGRRRPGKVHSIPSMCQFALFIAYI